mgnify:CR=1 FL=1
MKEYMRVDSIDSLEEAISKVRKAQKKYSKYSQEQVDKIFQAAAIAANKARIPLAKMAVEETGMGIVEDKIIKNHYAAEYIYNKYRDILDLEYIYSDIKTKYDIFFTYIPYYHHPLYQKSTFFKAGHWLSGKSEYLWQRLFRISGNFRIYGWYLRHSGRKCYVPKRTYD